MRKPKGMTLIKLPPVKPDSCYDCPLCGLIPAHYNKPKGSHETHVCCGTYDALTTKGVKLCASKRDSHHPLTRPCDKFYEAWTQLPERYFAVPDEAYLTMILPFMRGQQIRIKFHNYGNRQDKEVHE